MEDEIDSEEDIKMEREVLPRVSSPPPAPVAPAAPAPPAMSGVAAFFIKDTPKECWRYPLESKVAARKAFQITARKQLQREGKRATRYRWRDDGLAIDWVRVAPVARRASYDDEEIQVLENPPPAPIPTFVLEDSPEPEPRPPPSSSSTGEGKRWSPYSPPVAKRLRVYEPPEWQSTAGGWLDGGDHGKLVSSSPAASNSALPEARYVTADPYAHHAGSAPPGARQPDLARQPGSSVPPDRQPGSSVPPDRQPGSSVPPDRHPGGSVPPDRRQPGSSVPPEATRARSSVPPDALLEIRAQMQALEEEMGARMRALQEQMLAAMQQDPE